MFGSVLCWWWLMVLGGRKLECYDGCISMCMFGVIFCVILLNVVVLMCVDVCWLVGDNWLCGWMMILCILLGMLLNMFWVVFF